MCRTSSPAGTAESSPGQGPGLACAGRAVPQGRLRVTQDTVLGWLPRITCSAHGRGTPGFHPGEFSAVPAGLLRLSNLSPGLTSWATLSRPYGTQFGEGSSHADCLSTAWLRSCCILRAVHWTAIPSRCYCCQRRQKSAVPPLQPNFLPIAPEALDGNHPR